MRRLELDLTIGATVQIGNRLVTVVDVEGTEVNLRVETVEMEGFEESDIGAETAAEWQSEVRSPYRPR